MGGTIAEVGIDRGFAVLAVGKNGVLELQQVGAAPFEQGRAISHKSLALSGKDRREPTLLVILT